MIHKFKMLDKFIVVDVNSGAVHGVDEIAYELLGDAQNNEDFKVIGIQNYKVLTESFCEEKVEEALEELLILAEEEMLFSDEPFEDFSPNISEKPILKSLCLHICHDCNLRCKYCFAGTGSFGGVRTMMTAEVGKKAIDLLIKESAHRHNLEVDFFGGEPLMNFDVVKEIVEYARSKEKEFGKNFRFTITTNALGLNDEKIEYINQTMNNVVLSIDGRKETNDNMRLRLDNSGSYDAILPKIQRLVEARQGKNYYVRGTFTRENLDFSKDVLHLADLGFKQISIEPVVANCDSGIDLRIEDLPVLFEEYEKLAKEYVERQNQGKGFNFFHFMIDLNDGPCIAKRTSGCGAGHEYAAVTPEGDLYPCHQFVGLEDFKIGDVFNGVNREDIRKDFRVSNISTRDDCKVCWAKYYCSGGCVANAWQFNNSLDLPYKVGCELEKKRVEVALWIKANTIYEL